MVTRRLDSLTPLRLQVNPVAFVALPITRRQTKGASDDQSTRRIGFDDLTMF